MIVILLGKEALSYQSYCSEGRGGAGKSYFIMNSYLKCLSLLTEEKILLYPLSLALALV